MIKLDVKSQWFLCHALLTVIISFMFPTGFLLEGNLVLAYFSYIAISIAFWALVKNNNIELGYIWKNKSKGFKS